MNTEASPKGMRLHIGIFGRRNVGKSSLLNAITRQEVSIVAPEAGTTTDPVEKPMELLPLGPVLFIDTAGIDDEGALGELRAQAEMQSQKAAREQARALAELRARTELEAEKAQQAEAARLAQLARERTLSEAERQVIEARHLNATREAELSAALAAQKARTAAELKEFENIAAAKVQQRELEMKRLAHEVQAAALRATKEIENMISDDRIRMALVDTGLPAVAAAFAQKFGEVKFTSFGGDASDPSALIGKGITQVMTLVKDLGAELLPARKVAGPTTP